ncbi:MAG: LacI family transcriptional regulator [Thermoflexales bacterium]|nr:LacI family transcriptional regulator [Thermoflexales bacterium]
MPSSATLRDVAKLAGVSLGTASQALNNRPHVLPETRNRVLDAARTLGYTPRNAGSTQSLSIIGMLTKHDVGPPGPFNAFFSHVHAGIEQECRAHRISLMFASVEVDQSNHPVEWPRMIEDNHIDGLILIGIYLTDEAHGELEAKLGRRIVLVDSYAPGASFDSVLIDNLGGARKAVNHLIDLGHRHIGLIGSNPASSPDILERREGYLRALAARGIAQTYIEESLMRREEGYAALGRLLKRAPQVTAVFVTNDDTAIGVLHAAQDMGLRVPEDLSIVGFDDIDLASEIQPALTTVHVPKAWLGKLGVQRLLERVRAPDQPTLAVTVATHLVERESTARQKSSQKEVVLSEA